MTVLLGILLLQVPAVQSAVARRVLSGMTGKINGQISVGKVQLLPFKTLIIRDFVLIDDNPLASSFFEPQDTVARLDYAAVSFSLKGLLNEDHVCINKVTVRGGEFTLVSEGNHSHNLKRIFGMGTPHPMEDKGDVLIVHKADIRDFRYKMFNVIGEKHEYAGYGINWFDLDVKADIQARQVRVHDASVSGIVDDMSLVEKSGYSSSHISGRTRVRSGKAEVYDFRLTDEWSDLDMPYFAMTYANYKSFRDFVNDVKLSGKLRNTHLDFRTLEYFAPVRPMAAVLDISEAEVRGPVNNLNVSSIRFKDESGVSGDLSCHLKGLMDMPGMEAEADINSLSFTTAALERFMGELSPGIKASLGSIAPGESFTLSGKGGGPVNNLRFDGRIDSGAGKLRCDLNVQDLLSEAPMRIGGTIHTEDVDISQFISSDAVRYCTLGTKLHASLDKGNTSLTIDSLGVSRLNVLGYDYTGISAAGTFSNNEFDGRIISSDPNLNFLMQGVFNLSPKTRNALYNFVFSLGYADLNALHIDNRGTSKVSLTGKANFMRVVKGDIIGNIALRDLVLENSGGRHRVGNIDINSYSNDEDHRINLTSSFAEGSYTGTKPFTALLDAIRETTLSREAPALAGARPGVWDNDRYSANLRIHDAANVLSFALPGLYIADGTALHIGIDKAGVFDGSLKSQRIAFKDKYLKDLDVKASDRGDSLRLNVRSSELRYSGIRLVDNSIGLSADADHMDASYAFRNGGSKDPSGSLALSCDFARDADDSLRTVLRMHPSSITVNDGRWELRPAQVTMYRGDIGVQGVELSNGRQHLTISGGMSRSNEDTLSVNIRDLGLEVFTPFIGEHIALGGKANGSATLISPVGEKKRLQVNMRCDSTLVNGYDAGRIRMASTWDDEGGKMDFDLSNDIYGKSTVSAAGYYRLADNRINADVRLDEMEVGYASSLLKSVFSEMEGKASGKINVSGPLDRLSIRSSDGRLDNAKLRVAYTNVPYFLSGPFHITDNGVSFDDISLTDRYRGTGTVSGGILFDHLRDFRLATFIKASNVEAFDTELTPDAPVYGKISASGNVYITGPFSAVLMDISAVTSGGGHFHIPLKADNHAVGTDILTFKEPEVKGWVDPYEQMMQRMSESSSSHSDFSMRMHIGVRPEVECHLELDPVSGNALSGHGSGTINLEIGPPKGFSINGDYILSDGRFKFSAMGIANRDFGIDNGSSIKFNGDIMDSDLDISAKYTTKTSLAALIADTTSVHSRRTVECELGIADKLRNPRLSFNVNVPDLDPTTKSLVETSLNTDDKIQKQFLALLVTNSFLPGDQSGIVNNTDMLFSNVTDIMSGQLNNILQRLDIPLDLGLKYQPNEGGTDIFDVAVSTQLFNNRVSVNGNIGNRQYSMSGTEQDVVGDLDIDMKVDKAGAVRVSMFSHSADQYSNYLDYSQRNGVGISYQKEFNTIGDFIRGLFSSKKAREQRMQEILRDDKKTIIISKQDE